jgi:hypothetical protein
MASQDINVTIKVVCTVIRAHIIEFHRGVHINRSLSVSLDDVEHNLDTARRLSYFLKTLGTLYAL